MFSGFLGGRDNAQKTAPAANVTLIFELREYASSERKLAFATSKPKKRSLKTADDLW